MTTRHPVRLRLAPSLDRKRIHIAIRLVLLIALGVIGFSSVYWLLYLALPAIAGLLIAQKGGERYLAEDAPPIFRVLRWLAAAYGYLWLLTDHFSVRGPSQTVALELTPGPAPRASAALLRLLFSIPAVLLLALLSFVAAALWVIGAIVILVTERAPAGFEDFIGLTLRYQFRLFAYHLSLVEAYPTLEPDEAPHSPGRDLTPHATAGPGSFS